MRTFLVPSVTILACFTPLKKKKKKKNTGFFEEKRRLVIEV